MAEYLQNYDLHSLFGSLFDAAAKYQASSKNLWYSGDQIHNPLSHVTQGTSPHPVILAENILAGANIGPVLFSESLSLTASAISVTTNVVRYEELRAITSTGAGNNSCSL